MVMRALLIAAMLFLAAPMAAHAADGSIWSRDVPLAAARSPAAVSPAKLFDLVGVHWRGPGRVDLRTRSGAGSWSPWRTAAPEAEDRPDRGAIERTRAGWRVGNPWWAPGSTQLDLRTVGSVSKVRAWFVRSAAARVPVRQVAFAGSPKIVPRSGWRADERIVRSAPRYAPVLRFAVVHHTAGASAYAPEASAAIVRGIELYHVKANGWNDIGYNFLVDRYGQVFEGRRGGMQRNVIGAHAEGFNTGSVGIALIGTYAKRPTREAEDALAKLLAWRLDVGHVDPASSAMVTSGGSSKVRAGAGVYLRAISGHRDIGFTACPGDGLYARLGQLREVALTTGLPKLYGPRITGRLGKFVRFKARLSQPLEWTVTVTGADGETVAQRSGTGDRISWFWDSSTLEPGRYRWTMEAGGVRPAKGILAGSSGPAPSPAPAAPATGLVLQPRVVSPDGDGYADVLTARYTLREPSTVSASLEDEGGLTVVSFSIDARQGKGLQILSWAPDPLADGRYRLVVTARGASGRTVRLVDELVVMRALAWLRADPPTISPNGDGVEDSLTISFVLRQAGLVAVELRDGTFPLALLQSGWLEPGSHGALWNGHVGAERPPPGVYSIWVTVSNDVGTVTQKVPITITA
jgi:hypothetical protein